LKNDFLSVCIKVSQTENVNVPAKLGLVLYQAELGLVLYQANCHTMLFLTD